MLAMQRAVASLHIAPEYVLIDGNRCPALPVPSMAVLKRGNRVAEISAASILAKGSHPRRRNGGAGYRFPQYGFAQHKAINRFSSGRKLAQYGATAHHRHAPVKRPALGLVSDSCIENLKMSEPRFVHLRVLATTLLDRWAANRAAGEKGGLVGTCLRWRLHRFYQPPAVW